MQDVFTALMAGRITSVAGAQPGAATTSSVGQENIDPLHRPVAPLKKGSVADVPDGKANRQGGLGTNKKCICGNFWGQGLYEHRKQCEVHPAHMAAGGAGGKKAKK
uniref:Uncharacterized protein n=1 Tax=Chlamydomonas leiostraca TaxID=1034604 RepID=A0A7S0R983_9CHLO